MHVHRGWVEVTGSGTGAGSGPKTSGVKNIHRQSYTIIQYSTLFYFIIFYDILCDFLIFYSSLIGCLLFSSMG